MTAPSAPAGWYPRDPAAPAHLHYWDGTAWTGHQQTLAAPAQEASEDVAQVAEPVAATSLADKSSAPRPAGPRAWYIWNTTERGWCVVRDGAKAVQVIVVVLWIVGAFAIIGSIAGSIGGQANLGFGILSAVFWALVLILPGIILNRFFDSSIDPIAAVVDVRSVAGGTVVTLLDSRSRRREVLTDARTADSLTRALEARAG